MEIYEVTFSVFLLINILLPNALRYALVMEGIAHPNGISSDGPIYYADGFLFWMLLVGVGAWGILIGWAHSYLWCIPNSVKLHNAKIRELSAQNGDIYTC